MRAHRHRKLIKSLDAVDYAHARHVLAPQAQQGQTYALLTRSQSTSALAAATSAVLRAFCAGLPRMT